jgi:hypothetical protein
MSEPIPPDFGGMTVNERLVVAGLVDDWDQAVHRRDRTEMIRILELVDVMRADQTADAVLANPAFYGLTN